MNTKRAAEIAALRREAENSFRTYINARIRRESKRSCLLLLDKWLEDCEKLLAAIDSLHTEENGQ